MRRSGLPAFPQRALLVASVANLKPPRALALDDDLAVQAYNSIVAQDAGHQNMKHHTTIVLLGWVLYSTTGSASALGFFPTEAACKAAGLEAVADGKAAKAKEETDEAAFERKHPGESEGTTIGYDVEWKCYESKPKPQATPPS